jgi:small subunit ribosomal protein S1
LAGYFSPFPPINWKVSTPHRAAANSRKPIWTCRMSSENVNSGENSVENPVENSVENTAPSVAAVESDESKAARIARAIKIGSRRGGEAGPARPFLAGATHEAPPSELDDAAGRSASTRDLTPGPAIVPSKRGKLSDELEKEIEDALGGMSLDEVLSADSKKPLEQSADNKNHGTIVRVDRDMVFVVMGGRNEGMIPLIEFKTPPTVGQHIDVVVRKFNNEDGIYELGLPGAATSVDNWEELEVGSVVDAKVTGANTGGLEVSVNSMRGFIPISQIAMYRVENIGEFVGQRLQCIVMEANAARKKLVLSRRSLLEREKEESKAQQMKTLEVGQIKDGLVRKIMDFGAFVDMDGLEGLIHISQMSWDRIKHPSEVLKEGQKVQVKIEKIDPANGKIGLSFRELTEHPWKSIGEQFHTGQVVKGVVTRTAEFGAFVKLAPGIEGLVHVSELAHHRVFQISNYAKEGQEVEVKILSIDPQAQKMSLSLKATLAPPPGKETKKPVEEQDEAPREAIIPKRQAPLKGGTKGQKGGEKFGLNW